MFTDMEKALMAGGQSIDHKPKNTGMMSFVQELKEARMLLKQNDIRLTYQEACEDLYLCILAVEFLSRIKQTQDLARRYSQQTTSYYNYEDFRANGTDMYNFIYFVSTTPARVEKIFNSPDAARQRERTHLPIMALNGYLTSMTTTGNRDMYFIMRVENHLGVTNGNSKEIRRLLSYDKPTQSDVTNIASKLMNEFRSRMPILDLLPEMQQKLAGTLDYDRKR